MSSAKRSFEEIRQDEMLDDEFLYWEYLKQQEYHFSPCCDAPVRYLNCDTCKDTDEICIYICTECGKEV